MTTPRDGTLQARPATSLGINPRIFAVAAINAILAAAFAVVIVPIAWTVDGDRNLRAAQALLDGTIGQDHGYLYSPLAAAITVPVAVLLPHAVAVTAWLIGRLAGLLAMVARETAGLSTPDRFLVAIGVVSFVPVLHDLVLGNVSILILGAVGLVSLSADRYLVGLPMGLVLATVPKPALIPILLWMLVFRRRAALGSIASAAVFSLAGLAILGAGTYASWLQVLLHPDYLGTNQAGNLALGAMFPAVLAWPLTGLTVIGTLVAVRTGETPGFIACLCAGLLVAPYTMAYGAVLLLLALRPLAQVGPKRTFVLAATGSLGVVTFLPFWVGAILVSTLVVPRAAWHPMNQGVAA